MFELSEVKKYVFCPSEGDTLYTSRILDAILEKTNGNLAGVYAAIEIPNGLNLFYINYNCNKEPYVFGRFMHYETFLKFNSQRKIVEL